MYNKHIRYVMYANHCMEVLMLWTYRFPGIREIPENPGKFREIPEIPGNSPENPAGKFGVFSYFQAVIAYKRL